MVGTAGDEASPLVGRDQEQSLLRSVLDEVATRGQALVLRGEPGIGKSRLLSGTARIARERGIVVLATTGVQSEADLPLQDCINCSGPCAGVWPSCPRFSAQRSMPLSA